MTYALIGCGRIAQNHISAALSNNLEVAALCDSDIPTAQDLKEKNKLESAIFADYKKMLHELKPDIVAIATPSGTHADIAINCIRADCNVLIEKPIALSIEDADKIIEESKTKNIIVACCHQNRFNRSVQKLHGAVKEGRFGRIYNIAAHIRWNRNRNYYDQAKWRGTWAQDGGCLMNQCIHNVDLLRWIMGCDVDEAFSYTTNAMHPYIEAEDIGLAVVKFLNGGLGLIDGTVNVYPKNLEETLYVFGERGTVKLGGASVNRIDEWMFEDGLDSLESVQKEFNENPPNVYGFGHSPLYSNLIKAIEDGTKPYITAEDGKKSMEIILAIYKSSFTNKPIKFPVGVCSTLDFSGHSWR